MPKGISWKSISLVGVVAGIGFTMAIFIAGLAFPDPRMLGTAKVAVLRASAIAGVFALIFGRILLPKKPPADVAPTEDEAESSLLDARYGRVIRQLAGIARARRVVKQCGCQYHANGRE